MFSSNAESSATIKLQHMISDDQASIISRSPHRFDEEFQTRGNAVTINQPVRGSTCRPDAQDLKYERSRQGYPRHWCMKIGVHAISQWPCYCQNTIVNPTVKPKNVNVLMAERMVVLSP
ncbi:hypothetical protein HYE67_009119 [Fusarium culmorum]|uniref:Uncharacterized protein n=1 Tax=Fusarium culmorum TaxID=5516 RepID=A0A2T4H9X7_FUSCU|nr:hypothetical protein FCULG_00003836 [Fusarium culmorum]QPC66888.1 hypothetical protein HYE67_009119 [Fusarium culmorum]